MAELASRALHIEHQEREHMDELQMLGLDRSLAATPPVVDGRVFQRLYRYHLLPPPLQLLSDAVAVHLVTPEVRKQVFATGKWRHPSALGPCVRGNKLLAAIKDYVQTYEENVSDLQDSAKQVAEALVLSGFISPVHEPENEDSIVMYVSDKDYYELVAPGAQQIVAAGSRRGTGAAAAGERRDESTARRQNVKMSVWGVTDGATRAGAVFRKPNTMSPILRFLQSLSLCGARPREKRFYAVINKTKYHSLYLFSTDTAREELTHLDLQDVMVQYEAGSARAPLYHGLKIWDDTHSEVLDFVSKTRQEEWLLALLDAGAKYKEANRDHDKWASPDASFYSLTDADASGKRFLMEDLVGSVVLVVNVASKDPQAPLQYPELVTIADKYHDDGFTVLAFPSDQFGGDGQEFDTDGEILSYLVQAYKVNFPIMTKRDVNGLDARDAFLYLNAHLPGSFGPFTEWNFTKFLIDRHGKPFKRYETSVLPQSLEADIRQLLESPVPESVARQQQQQAPYAHVEVAVPKKENA
uniref:Glutathione peroxidase n=1 Tax=Globisporangium ultimum (strain ATCC 200006 / CBS 805.95 / DAOM BR144) TaxID=431595 RepID=K3WJA0_GLOUD